MVFGIDDALLIGLPALFSAGAGLLGGKMRDDASKEAADKNYAMQKEFAQNGIRWKVQDAVAAGLHPLAALGANTYQASPSFIGDSGVGAALSNAGQDISRAVSASRTQSEREFSALQLAGLRADVEGKTLDNQIRLSRLRQLSVSAPAMAGDDNFIPGQGNSPLVQDKPLERVISAPGRPAQEAGWRPDVAYARTDTGLTPVVPESLSESLEDDIVGKLLWRFRNQLMPNIETAGKPPLHMLPKGATDWQYSFTRQEWQPIRGKGQAPYERWSDRVKRKIESYTPAGRP